MIAAALVLLVFLTACAGTGPVEKNGPAPVEGQRHSFAGPRLLALGTAQDGGLPHAACGCVPCTAARRDPARSRAVASLGMILPDGRRYLVDATPDIRPQLHALAAAAGRPPAGGVDRAPLDGIFLTHAHMGHYTGLVFLGFEAIHARGLPVHATPSLAAFLRTNGPWSQMVQLGNIALQELPAGATATLDANVSVTALAVPHRDESSDTVGYLLRGPVKTVLYVPDTDGWEAWEPALPEVLEREGVSIAILDATFYHPGELPDRDPAGIGHPLVRTTMELLQPLVDTGRLQVFFTHLNHSNPLLEPESEAHREVERRGFAVLADGQEIPF